MFAAKIVNIGRIRPTSNFRVQSCNFSFASFFKSWGNPIVYPPSPREITTNNRLFETYVSNANELHDLILFKEPLLLNFTYSDKKINKVTQSLFDILADKLQYPLNFPINLANISADTEGGRELMLTYSVGKIPTLLLLKNQLPGEKYVPEVDNFYKQDLINWLSTIKK